MICLSAQQRSELPRGRKSSLISGQSVDALVLFFGFVCTDAAGIVTLGAWSVLRRMP
jgi:hypothetical protein